MEIKRLLEEFDEEIIRSFVQKNADYYLAKWKVMATTNSKISWNWAAFLATTLWMGYRKMYLYAFLVILITLLEFIPIVGLIVWLALWIGIGMFGNFLYGKYTYNKLVELKTTFQDEELFKNQVVKSGGTSIGGVFLIMLISFIIYFIVTAIFVSLTQTYSNTGF